MKIHPDVYRFMFTGLGLFSLVLLFFSFDCAERRGCFKNPPLVLGCKEDCAKPAQSEIRRSDATILERER